MGASLVSGLSATEWLRRPTSDWVVAENQGMTAAQAVVPLGAALLRWLLEISKVSLELGYWNIGALFPQAH